jgi:hypothetical protein
MAYTADDSASSNPSAGGDGLVSMARAWPTPKARDAKGPENANRNSPSLETFAQLGHPGETTPPDGTNGSPEADLNPSFVESLMGLPDGWSDPVGLSERLHALGNGLVPQAGAHAVRQLIARSAPAPCPQRPGRPDSLT